MSTTSFLLLVERETNFVYGSFSPRFFPAFLFQVGPYHLVDLLRYLPVLEGFIEFVNGEIRGGPRGFADVWFDAILRKKENIVLDK